MGINALSALDLAVGLLGLHCFGAKEYDGAYESSTVSV